MAWTIEFSDKARKALNKRRGETSARIVRMLDEVAALDDPRQRGKALTGEFAGLWRYRAGDWRVIAQLEDGRLVIVVIALGHRRDVYRR